MIRSMTGYGRGERRIGDLSIAVEVRSVNHRFLDVKLKLPPEAMGLEAELRRRIGKQVSRGRVDAAINLQRTGGSARFEVNRPLVKSYLRAVRSLQAELDLAGVIDLRMALQVPGAVRQETDRAAMSRREETALRGVVDEAVSRLTASRDQEGARLGRDLGRRLGAIRRQATIIGRRTAGLAPERAERLRQRVARLADGVAVEPARLAQEVALLADRGDVAEELVRLDAHLDTMAKLLESNGRPVGKELDFLTQELHRETNTIGAKAGDLRITQATLAIKSEVEKIREQVQNVE